ncbi:MAG: glycoside hydrolase family 3 N-terminal domain-containing protein [Gemmatimonadaceae bacterium]|nr:glycoside hydrolase family 3 N-terminal domain-containing protein [Gemmatimonadaceae bacterium]
MRWSSAQQPAPKRPAASPATTRGAAPPAARPWMNAALPAVQRAQLLLRAMTLEEKFHQLYMAPGDPVADSATWARGAYGVQLLAARNLPDSGVDRAAATRSAARLANAAQRFFVERTRLGVPVILFEEGVHGLLQDGATIFPQAIALAATWDTALVGRVAAEIARASRERGVRQLLSPVINLARDPRWGRVEETYGEDAWLSSAMGLTYTRAIERAGVVATPKHFVVNHGDGGRDSYPVAIDAATLEDLHFPPFRAAIQEGGARSVMASYNSVNGVPASMNRDLLTRTLRGAWRFDGVVISDASAVGGARVLHHTAKDYPESAAQALRAGLDVIFQGGAGDAPLFWPAFRDGLVPRAAVDTAVSRVLRLKFALGLFERSYVNTVAADAPSRVAAAHALAVEAAERSIVLLHNERGTLPLKLGRRGIAVIGDEAVALPFGGYSARPRKPASLVDALRARLADSGAVQYAPGPERNAGFLRVVSATSLTRDSAGARAPGLRGEYFAGPDLLGSPATVRTDAQVDFQWTFNRPARGLSTDWYSVRWTGFVDVPAGGAHLAVEGDDGYRLFIGDSLAIDAWRKVSYSQRVLPSALAPGRHAIRLEYRQTTGSGRVRLLWSADAGEPSDARIARAVELASQADAAVITVHVTEGEFKDRASLHLPGRQEELIARVAATGTPVVVIIIAGGAVIATPWLERVGAVLQAFYPGEGGAEALARVLFGDANPAARLPYTVPRSEGQLPLVYDHLPTGRGDDYVDLTGQPLFPFGYGLSYTTFSYRDLALSHSRATERDTVHVRFVVRNDGQRAGDEVVQLYVRHVTAATAQPVLALRAFARVPLGPGEERTVDLALPVHALATRDALGAKVVRDGEVVLYVGASSRDIRLRGTLHTLGAPR